jgi:hypothetical protein
METQKFSPFTLLRYILLSGMLLWRIWILLTEFSHKPQISSFTKMRLHVIRADTDGHDEGNTCCLRVCQLAPKLIYFAETTWIFVYFVNVHYSEDNFEFLFILMTSVFRSIFFRTINLFRWTYRFELLLRKLYIRPVAAGLGAPW